MSEFKQIIEKLDAMRPKLEDVDWTTFDYILNNVDFTKTRNTMEAMKLFYSNLWSTIIFKLQDDLHLQQRESGRLIVEADSWRRKFEAAESELQTIREAVPKESN